MSAKLATIAADPTRLENVRPEELPELIGEVEGLKATMWARLQATSVPHVTPAAPERPSGPDKLLSVTAAAERLGVSRRWMYRKADELPFTRRLSGGTLRFSEKGLERWKESRRAA